MTDSYVHACVRSYIKQIRPKSIIFDDGLIIPRSQLLSVCFNKSGDIKDQELNGDITKGELSPIEERVDSVHIPKWLADAKELGVIDV